MDFIQKGPNLSHQWQSDALLKSYADQTLPKDILHSIEPHLLQMGEDSAGFLLSLADQAEREIPKHIPFSPWGQRIDRIEVSDAWKKLEIYSAQNGIVASGYERKQGEYSRMYQAMMIYLFHPSSAFFTCPLAMTDGAARALELYGSREMKSGPFRNLVSRDPKTFWTSGQWMTEKTGGSDVGLSQTKAVSTSKGWELHGVKWFTSATTSQMAMALARPEGAPEGGKGLSLFSVKLRNEDGTLRNIEILRLKDKLGTKALPTAELELKGTPAELVGDLGGGVKKISSLFNVTRIYNAICAIADMRRGLALAESYANERFTFGRMMSSHGLHQETFLSLQTDFAKCFHFTFSVAHLLGKDECGTATADESALLRLLTPLLKLYTGKKAVSVVSEVLEIFGGQGYIEDSGLPRLMRNVQVFPIWEGTTNVLALDLLRALSKEAPFEVFEKQFLAMNPSKELLEAFDRTKHWMNGLSTEELQSQARTFALNLCELWTVALLQKFAKSPKARAEDQIWAARATALLKKLV